MIEREIKNLAASKGLDVVEEVAGYSVQDNGKQIRFCFTKDKLQIFLKTYVKKVKPSQEHSSERIIICPSCKQKLKIKTPLPSSVGKCTQCTSRFEIYIDENDHISIIKIDSTNSTNNAKSEINDIDDCFLILGVDPNSISKDIKLAYRKKVNGYHPDKVESLGDKIKVIAEAESKKLNTAYSMLKDQGYV